MQYVHSMKSYHNQNNIDTNVVINQKGFAALSNISRQIQ